MKLTFVLAILFISVISCNKIKESKEEQDLDTITKLLEVPEVSNPNVDYQNIAIKIIKMNNDELIEKYVNFILNTQNSADEQRSLGLGDLYSANPLKIIEIINKKTETEKLVLIDNLSFGLANTHHVKIDKENAKSLIVGSQMEAYQQPMAQQIYEKVLKILSDG